MYILHLALKITVARLPCVAAVGVGLHVDMTAYVFHFVFTPLSPVVVQSIVFNICLSLCGPKTEQDIYLKKSVFVEKKI